MLFCDTSPYGFAPEFRHARRSVWSCYGGWLLEHRTSPAPNTIAPEDGGEGFSGQTPGGLNYNLTLGKTNSDRFAGGAAMMNFGYVALLFGSGG